MRRPSIMKSPLSFKLQVAECETGGSPVNTVTSVYGLALCPDYWADNNQAKQGSAKGSWEGPVSQIQEIEYKQYEWLFSRWYNEMQGNCLATALLNQQTREGEMN